MQNQITVEQVYELANTRNEFTASVESEENSEFFAALIEQYGPESHEHFKDNLALAYYGYQIDAEFNDVSVDVLKRVYLAAKTMFARHPGKPFEFDIESAYAGIGSPWCNLCNTPEMWVISWARRYNETDEGAIDFVDESVLTDVLKLMSDLTWVGVPQEVVRENLAYICYDNEDLIKRLSFN